MREREDNKNYMREYRKIKAEERAELDRKKEKRLKSQLHKISRNLTLEIFINALILSGIFEKLAQSGRKFKNLQKFQFDYLESFVDRKIKITVNISSRGGSKTLLAALGIVYLMFKYPKFKVSSMSGSLEQLQQLTTYVETILAKFHKFIVTDNKTHKKLLNGSEFKRLPMKETGSRSIRADLAVYDESVLISKEVMESLFGQLAVSKYSLMRFLTTPNSQARDEGLTKQISEMPGVEVFRVPYTECSFISKSYVNSLKPTMSRSRWLSEYCCVWGSSEGAVYDSKEVDISLIPRSELPPKEKRQSIRIGHDWGRIHPSVAVKGFLADGIDRNGECCKILYIYDMKVWTTKDNMTPDKVINDLVIFGSNCESITSEDEPFNQYENDRLAEKCESKKIHLIRQRFVHKKSQMTAESISRFNNMRIKIVDDLTELIRSIKNSVYDKNGKIRKVNGDDPHDAFLHLNHSYEDTQEIEIIQPSFNW